MRLMDRFLKLFLVFALAMVFTQEAGAASGPEFKKPDFAYPKTVIANAQKLLASADNAAADRAGIIRLRAMLELCCAEREIDRNKAFVLPAEVEKQIALCKGDKAAAAMLTLYEARLYKDIYSSDSWKYNRVDAPLTPLPADVSQWSGDQFRARVAALLADARTMADATPLTRFKDCLEYSDEALQYLPTVRDFAMYLSVNILNAVEFGKADFSKEMLEICREGVAASAQASAPWFYWTMEEIKRGIRNDRQRTERLTDLYARYSGTEAARYILQALAAGGYDDIMETEYDEYGNATDEKTDYSRRDRMIGWLRTSLADFPKWYGNNSLRNALNRLTQSTAVLSAPSMTAPGKDFEVKVRSSFAKKITVGLYLLPAGGSDLSAQAVMKRTPLMRRQQIACTATDEENTLVFNAVNPGRYALVMTLDGKTSESSMVTVDVTPFLGLSAVTGPEAAAITADFTTGKPVEGVRVNLVWPRGNSRFVGKTGSEGLLRFDTPTDNNRGAHLSFTYKDRNYDFDNDLYIGAYRGQVRQQQSRALIFTDRGIYHPGDTVRWAVAIAAGMDKESARTAENVEVTVKFFDANRQPVDTVTATTDSYGRAYGEFVTRKGVLTGEYSINVSCRVNDQRCSAYGSVMVSDFKAPEIQAEITSVQRDVPTVGSVVVKGRASTYSGMPVAGAAVTMTVRGVNLWRWFMPDATLGTLNAVTDDDGCFEVVVPAALLATEYSGRSYRFFSAEVTVTSSTAETAQTQTRFSIGKPYAVSVEVPQNASSDSPFRFTPKALGAGGEAVPLALKWHFVDADKKAVGPSGQANAGSPVNVDVRSLPSACYSIVVEPVDTTQADAVTSSGINFYSFIHNTMPATVPPLYMPVTDAFMSRGKAMMKVGANADRIWVYGIVRSGNKIFHAGVTEISRGFRNMNLPLPDSLDDCQVQLLTVAGGKVYTQDVTLRLPEKPKVEIVAESFRDRLVPGSAERWRFRIVRGKDGIANAAMIATMYNQALEALYSNNWPSAFGFYNPQGYLNLRYSRLYSAGCSSAVRFKYLDEKGLTWPTFLFDNSGMVLYDYVGSARFKSALSSRVLMANAKFESVEEDAAEPESAMVSADSAPMNTEAGSGAEAGAGAAQSEPEVEYREAEVLQAFWKPALVADADGNIDIEFSVPNANGSWRFLGFAWNKAAEAASYKGLSVASRPVMVQPNLPRFLRQGDRATILATVFNNSDEAAAVKTVVEIFRVSDGAVVETFTSTDSIAPMGSAIVSARVTAPATEAAVGYRVRAISGSFADGEQAAIPVLASASTVIESTEFYLNPGDSKPFDFTVNAPKDAQLTLQYCQNPVWTVVKAMRGIAGNESLTATGTASQLFSALAATHIVEHNADIAAALKLWSANPDEKALTSMLEKNETLKKLMLDQTPWVQAAKSNTERMQMLVRLLDPDASALAISNCRSRLAKYQNSDGGFRWGSWAGESSVWTTESVLVTLGIARSLGILPADFDAMLDKAFAYLQREAAKPGMPDTDETLTLISTYFPGFHKTTVGELIIRRTVAAVAKGWKDDGTVGKAYDTFILAANGRRLEAEKVMQSIRQFAVEKPGMGLCFPNVNDMRGYATMIQAYHVMDAPRNEIDALRQYVIVQAQAMDDIGACNPDYIVAAVLMTGSGWTSTPVKQNVTVNGRPLEIGNMESCSGYFSRTLTEKGKVRISVASNGVTPSYGSVTAIYSRSSKSVKARPGRDLSIEKRFLVERDGQWTETETFELGRRVRVQLIVKAGRDLEYVSIDDERPAAFEPVDQLPGFVWDGSLGFYRESQDASTRLFIGYLPKGTYHIVYDMTAAASGSFTSGIATLQSQYAPELTAHSGGTVIEVAEK